MRLAFDRENLLFLCHITSLDLSMDNMQCPPWVLSIAQLFSEAEKGKKEERQSVPVKVITMLAYGNIGKRSDHWCPAVPPLQPHLINCSTWTELAPRTKQHGQQHAMGHSLSSHLNCGSAETCCSSIILRYCHKRRK